MKELLVIIAFTCCIGSAMAQHYGGVTFTPYAIRNEVLNIGPTEGSWAKFAYAIGYQGLLMPQRRFSFSYGFQYIDIQTEGTYDPPKVVYFQDFKDELTLLKQRDDFESLQIPLWWRYNILKDKEQWQPYLAISTTIDLPLTDQYTYYSLEYPPTVYQLNSPVGLMIDFAAGVNYYLDKWCFSSQLTYNFDPFPRLGLGISVLRKF